MRYSAVIIIYLHNDLIYHKYETNITRAKDLCIERGFYMSVKARILALRLLDKQNKNLQYMKKIGVEVKLIKKDKQYTNKKQLTDSKIYMATNC